MNRKALFSVFFAICASLLMAHEWMGIEPQHRIGGRMASCGYMRGKVVLLDCRDYSKADGSSLAELQKIWESYKSKSFVLLGVHTPSGGNGDAAKKIVATGVTYPVYSNVGLKDSFGNDVELKPGLHVFEMTGRRLYSGKDIHQAQGVVGPAIFAVRIPSSAKQWKEALDYEIAYLPGSAYLRIKDLRTRKDALKALSAEYPDALKGYVKVWDGYRASPEIGKLAKLVEMARLVKDRDKTSAKNRRISASQISSLAAKYESLKKSENPFVVQEAKNSLADLEFAKAELSK